MSADGNRLSWGSPHEWQRSFSGHARLFKAEVRCFAVSHRFASGILTCLFLILGAKSQHAAFSLVLSMPLTRIHASSPCLSQGPAAAAARDPISRRGVGNITISMERVTLFSSRQRIRVRLGLGCANSYACDAYVLHLQRRTPHQLRCSRSRESGLYYLVGVANAGCRASSLDSSSCIHCSLLTSSVFEVHIWEDASVSSSRPLRTSFPC
jgi:hypothetical protein